MEDNNKDTIYALIAQVPDGQLRLYAARTADALLTFDYLLYVLKDNAIDNARATIDEIRAALETDGVYFEYGGEDPFQLRLIKTRLAG